MAETVEPDARRSDSPATEGSSLSMDDVQPSSPTDFINPTSPLSHGEVSNHSRPETSAGRRRKVPDSVTPNACTNCKKARAKVRLCLPVCYVSFYWGERKLRAKLSAVVRRSQASLSALQPTSNCSHLSLRDPRQDSKRADDSRDSTSAAKERILGRREGFFRGKEQLDRENHALTPRWCAGYRDH